jgi:hypothetical protein
VPKTTVLSLKAYFSKKVEQKGGEEKKRVAAGIQEQ